MRLVWAEIELDAIRENARQIRNILNEDTKIMSIIKANGYGHGASRVAKEALEEVSDYFGVAVLSEAVELRQKWITKPILILGYTDWKDFERVIQFDIMQSIFNLEQAQALNEVAGRMGAQAKVHIKVDTGMHRIGFVDQEASLEQICEIAQMPNLMIDGIFSHMASADAGDRDYCNMQLSRFLSFTEKLEERLVRMNDQQGRPTKIPIKHMANSATLLTMDQAHLDMVRPGIVLYGHYPSRYIEEHRKDLRLRQALTLKAQIVNLRWAKPKSRISYGGTYETKRETLIATLPLGYADGYPRSLSNRGYVLVRGQAAPVIGNVCMDQLMVDVTDIFGVKRGDVAVIFGRQKEKMVDMAEVANMTGTINYEIMTALSERVPRVYL